MARSWARRALSCASESDNGWNQEGAELTPWPAWGGLDSALLMCSQALSVLILAQKLPRTTKNNPESPTIAIFHHLLPSSTMFHHHGHRRALAQTMRERRGEDSIRPTPRRISRGLRVLGDLRDSHSQWFAIIPAMREPTVPFV